MPRATIFGTILFVFSGIGAFSQTSATPAAFEVASVRAGQPGREHIQATPGLLTMRSVTLRSALRWSYQVMDYQVVGPDWLTQQRYDITAKAAGPATDEELRIMCQNLLAERFKVALHHQSKEQQGYVLTVGKNGPKFTESKSDGESNIAPDQNRMTVLVERTPVSRLVELLSNILRTPIVDETGLKGRYDIKIDAAKYVMQMKRGDGPADGAVIDPISLIMSGIQEELGLKLESRRTKVDLLVVDHAEKTPVEN